METTANIESILAQIDLYRRAEKALEKRGHDEAKTDALNMQKKLLGQLAALIPTP